MFKKLLVVLALVLALGLTACGELDTIICADCETENDAANLYCSNCAREFNLEEKDENKIKVERIDNRYDISVSFMEDGKYEEALELLYQIEQTDDVIEQEKECNYQIAINLLDKGEKMDAFYAFIQLEDYNDSAEKIKEAIKGNEVDIFNEGVELYTEGVYDTATKYMKTLGDDKDAKQILKYIDKINEYQGVYGRVEKEGIRTTDYIVIEGNEYIVYDLTSSHLRRYPYQAAVTKVGDKYCIASKFDFPGVGSLSQLYLTKKDGELILHEDVHYDSKGYDYEKVDYTREELDEMYGSIDPKEDPYVGMTADEVKESTWGSPIKINKTIYSWGVKEQWVYTGYRYIYLQDGVVTAISE